MAEFAVNELTKVFTVKRSQIRAVDRVSLQVFTGELVVIVGPSGCGKSTTLRMVAGLEIPTTGTIHIDGKDLSQTAPKDREVAMVFQSSALFPQMTVFNNLAFGLKMQRCSNAEIHRRIQSIASELNLEPLLGRSPSSLSGGERQRVALGRAMVREPKVFLFDEPLANLDPVLRTRMRAEIKRLQHSLRAPILWVTHDQEEAMSLADRLAVMKAGAIQQCASPQEVYDRPANHFVATFMGSPSMNLFAGRLNSVGGQFCFEGDLGRIPVPAQTTWTAGNFTERAVVLGVRPEHVVVTLNSAASRQPDGSRHPSISVRVERVEFLGERVHLHLRLENGCAMLARVPRPFQADQSQELTAMLDPGTFHWFSNSAEGQRLN